MERANNARCSQHMTIERLYYLVKGEARPSNMRGIGSIEQKEVVMGFAGWRRTRPTISPEAEVVGSFGEG